MPTFIHIQANGQDLPGNPGSMQEIAGVELAEHTQVLSLYHDMNRGTGTGHTAAGQLSVAPVTIVKLQDGISPMLLQAFHENQAINAQIRTFDLNPATGQPREAYQITLLNGRIVGFRTELQPPVGSNDPGLPLERISIIPHTIRHSSLISATEHEFVWTSAT